MTSHAVVAAVRRLAGQQSVGHAGTLDPDAAGVLPVALGTYTRLLDYARLTPKIYQADLIFGVATATGDASGSPVGHSGPPWPSLADVEAAAGWMVGDVWQIPPAVSALKRGGERHYRAVQKGRTVWPTARRVQVQRLTVLAGQQQQWRIEATVGPGTYLRAIARDWGWVLGHGAHLDHLVRTQVGGFAITQSHDLAELAHAAAQGRWSTLLEDWTRHLDIPIIEVQLHQVKAIQHGRSDAWPDPGEGVIGPIGLTFAGQLLAVIDGPPWRYRKVLAWDR